jgi:DedD protein
VQGPLPASILFKDGVFMPLFRRSTAAESGATDAAPTPHLQALKRQARNRLIGMLVLVLAGIGLFAWVLDSEPRQTDRSIVYEIPARGESLSVHIPAQAREAVRTSPDSVATTATGATAAPVPTAAANDGDSPAQIRARRRAALAENEELLDEAPLAAGNDAPSPAKTTAPTSTKKNQADQAPAERERAEKLTEEKMAKDKIAKDKLTQEKLSKEKATKEKLAKEKAEQAKNAEAARARALLEGQSEPEIETKAAATATTTDTKASTTRSVVQFGSFGDAAKAAETRHKVEATGLKTYTQEIDTPRGKLIRLRVGPFNKAEDADAAAKKIKALGLPAAVLTL